MTFLIFCKSEKDVLREQNFPLRKIGQHNLANVLANISQDISIEEDLFHELRFLTISFSFALSAKTIEFSGKKQ